MTIRKLLLSALMVSAFALPALAEDGPGPGPGGERHGERMKNADTDGDGVLSKAEFMAVQEKRFDEMDGNKDGKISKEEMKAHRESMKAEFEAKKKEWEAKKKAGETPVAPAQ